MTNQQGTNNNIQAGKYKQGSGSEYHLLHASHVPDYGANCIDPNAEGFLNQTENNEQQ